MPIVATAEQDMLRESARAFLKDISGVRLSQSGFSDPGSAHQAHWSTLADMGWLGLGVSDSYGGTPADFSTLAILLEEMGRACFPGPFFDCAVLASMLVSEVGTDRQKQRILPLINQGLAIVTPALREGSSDFDGRFATMARSEGDEFILNGNKPMVPYAQLADLAICAARITGQTGLSDDAVGLFILPVQHPAITLRVHSELSGPVSADMRFTQVRVPADTLLGGRPISWMQVRYHLSKAMVGKCAEMVGGAQRAMEIAVDYAKERKQFGRPIGSFQAVQHHCSNMLVAVETMRRLTEESIQWIDLGTLSTERAAATKVWCNLSYREVIRLSHQILGGAGYIDDHMMPWYFRHARACETTLGCTDSLLSLLADAMFENETPSPGGGWLSLFTAAA